MTDEQKPDTKPGDYYVSVRDGNRHMLLAGPFRNDHAAALALVGKARDLAYEHDPKSHWYYFGTCRCDISDSPKKGVLNSKLGVS